MARSKASDTWLGHNSEKSKEEAKAHSTELTPRKSMAYIGMFILFILITSIVLYLNELSV